MKTKFLIPLIAGLGLLCACKGKSKSEVVNNNGNADSIKTDTSSQPKLVKTADMRFKVKNVQKTSEKITALTDSLNGMVIHHHMESVAEKSLDIRVSDDSVMRVSSFNSIADITVKIPSVKIEAFMNKVTQMGIYVNNRNMDITDKSLDYLSAQLKLKNRTEIVNQQKTGKVIIKNPANVLQLKDDMVDQQVNNKVIDDEVKNSIVMLSFYQSNSINKEIIANDDPEAYNLPFFKRLGRAIENGWEVFVDVVIALTNLWVFILAGLGAWLIFRNYKSKKPAALTKN
jgi:Domain of unknown function (DUF4349)